MFTNKILSSDARGYIIEIFKYKNFSILLIKSKKGTIRGNHYYLNETHLNYIVKGKIAYYWKKLNSNSKIKKKIYKKNEFFLTKKKDVHAMKFLEDSLNIYLSNIPRNKKNYLKKVRKKIILKDN